MAASININCGFSDVLWTYLGNQYTCSVTNLQLKSANESVAGINGVHPNGKSHDDVTALNVENQICHFMPRGFEEFFKNIQGLQIQNSFLKAISKEDLKPFPMLRGIWIRGNKLTAMQPNLFEFNARLECINFDANRIRSIAPGILDSIDDLEELYLSNNVCISGTAVNRLEVNIIEGMMLEKCQQKENADVLLKIEYLQKMVEQLRLEMDQIGVIH